MSISQHGEARKHNDLQKYREACLDAAIFGEEYPIDTYAVALDKGDSFTEQLDNWITQSVHGVYKNKKPRASWQEYAKQYWLLAPWARYTCVIEHTSIPSERVFSVAGKRR